MTALLDWDLAQATAHRVARTGPRVAPAPAAAVVNELHALVAVADEHVRDFTGLKTLIEHPPVRVVDRPDWITTNVAGLRSVIDPLLERLASGNSSPLANVGRAATAKMAALQAGGVLAYLSGRVLGQYEVFTSQAGQLLLVAQNIVEIERKLDVASRDFRLWVCIHEVTHRTQFGAVPWLRDHFLSEVQAFIQASDKSSATDTVTPALTDRLRDLVSSLSNSDSKSGSLLVDLVTSPAQREIIERLTALMTLIEGHAEFVMDGVGPDVIPTVQSIRTKFNARRQGGSPTERLARRLLGTDLKLRQYTQGRVFVASVIEKIGMKAFNQIWISPWHLPSPEELTEPQKWITRVSETNFLTNGQD